MTFLIFYYIDGKYDWKYYKCIHIYMAVTGWVTYNNGDEVHDDLSRRVCQRHVSRVCRRNPIFYLDVVKTIRQLIMSRTAWTLRRKDGIRQYKLSTGLAELWSKQMRLWRRDIACCQESQRKITGCITMCECISSRRCNSQGQVVLSVKTQNGRKSLTPRISLQSCVVSPFYGTVTIVSVRRCL